ncbi:LMBR1 domain-containing protein 2 [Phlyctochytrium bullatum]|nr:LMBR1 domain-containing protein 2 [Phlyctochytrium bullatum]
MWLAIVLLLLLAVGVANLLLYFGNWRTYPWYVQVTCFVAWMFPFAIILVLPLDLASTLYRNCEGSPNCDEPIAYVPEQFLLVFWQILYWTMFCLTWFTVPIMQSCWSRLWGAIKENLFYYSLFGVIGIIALLYIIFGMKINKMTDLMAFLMAAANAWGLLLCTFMLGYGFVDIPRKLWYYSSTRWHLQFLQLQAPKTKEAMVDAEAELYDVAKVRRRSPLRPLVDKLLEKCPFALNERMPDQDGTRPTEITIDYLKSLHARIKYGIRVYERNKAHETSFDKKLNSVFVKATPDKYGEYRLRALWWWYIWLKPMGMKVLSVICIIASAALIWSESTFQVKSIPLSIPALIMRVDMTFGAVEFISITFLLYMCLSAYSVLFQLKIFDFYVMVPDHHTDENSLLFVGAYLCVKVYMYHEVSRNANSMESEEGRNIIAQARSVEERRLNRAGAGDDDESNGMFSRDTHRRDRNAPRATNTKDLLAKYKSRGAKPDQPVEDADNRGVANLRDSPILSRSMPTGSSFSMKPSMFGKKAQTSGGYHRLNDEVDDSRIDSSLETAVSGKGKETNNRTDLGGSNQRQQGGSSSRVFGTAQSPQVNPAKPDTKPDQSKKINSKNIFGDI